MLTNDDRAEYGVRAMEVGAPDYEANDLETSAVDTMANIMHALRAEVAERVGHPPVDMRRVFESALMHYEDELNPEED